jgi:hypothetical protein
MSFRFPDPARPGRNCAFIGMACGSALLFASSHIAKAQEEIGSEPVGAWHGTFQLKRDDPRIRTRGGADLLRVEVIHSKGDETVDINWVTGRAICEDVTAPPCNWVGVSGIGRGRILGGDLVFALPLSADQTDPIIVILRRAPPSKNKHPATVGQLVNAGADFSYRFSWARVVQ